MAIAHSRLRAVLVACALSLSLARSRTRAEAPDAPSPLSSDWTGRSAIVQPAGRGHAALFGESRVGAGHGLQVGAHIAGLLALTPHASLLYRFLDRAQFHASARLGLAYPWPTLWLLTGKGAGALLPADTKPAHALLWDLGLRVSRELPRQQLVTLEAALVVAAKLTHTRSPLLDFPFLYPRFAALHAPLSARVSATAEGMVWGPFRWVVALDTWILPVVRRGFALEPRLGLAWVTARRVTLELGERLSYARYPVGLRFHSTPYLDVQVRF